MDKISVGPKLPGIYILWSVDGKSAYIGQSKNLYNRLYSHKTAIALGLKWDVLQLLPKSTKIKRLKLEAEWKNKLIQNGVNIISNTGHDTGVNMNKNMSRKQQLINAQIGREARLKKVREKSKSLKKICSKCKKEFFRTNEFFHKQKRSLDGLTSECKKCRNEINRLRSKKLKVLSIC